LLYEVCDTVPLETVRLGRSERMEEGGRREGGGGRRGSLPKILFFGCTRFMLEIKY
jgi:hypothetical protein